MKCLGKEEAVVQRSVVAVSNINGTHIRKLTVDLMIEILLRLPIKSLLCVKFVCKKLQRLVLSRAFIKLHRSLSLKKPRTLIQTDFFIYMSTDDITNQYLDQPYIPFNVDYQRNFKIIGSFNGIVHMLERKCTYIQYKCIYEYLRFILWNPSTREFTLEFFPAPEKNCLLHADFVFIHSSNTYKLASIYDDSIYLCTFNKDRLWRSCFGRWGRVPSYEHRFGNELVQLTNECLNWLAIDADNYEELVIVSLDMEREIVFNTKVGKITRNGKETRRKLAVLGESELGMFVYPYEYNVAIEWIEIHRGYLSKPDNCWNMTLHSTIKIPKIRNIKEPLGFWLHSDEGNNEIDYMKIILTNWETRTKFLYNLTDETFSETPFFEGSVSKIVPHIDTLESVNLSYFKYPEEVKTGKD